MSSGKVLIVEDNKNSAELIKDYLESWGYDVEVVYQGYDGLERIQKDYFDTILLDIMLPGLSGYEIAREVRAMNGVLPINIVMVSALGSTEDRVNAYNAGADHYLNKPLDFGELKAVLSRLGNWRQSLRTFEASALVMKKLGEALKVFSSEEKLRSKNDVDFVSAAIKDNDLSVEARNIIEFVSLYFCQISKLLSNQDAYEGVRRLFDGYFCTKDFFTIIERIMSIKLAKIEKKTKEKKKDEQERVGEWCYGLNLFLDCLEKNDGDYKKAFELYVSEAEKCLLTDEIADAISREIDNIELRKSVWTGKI